MALNILVAGVRRRSGGIPGIIYYICYGKIKIQIRYYMNHTFKLLATAAAVLTAAAYGGAKDFPFPVEQADRTQIRQESAWRAAVVPAVRQVTPGDGCFTLTANLRIDTGGDGELDRIGSMLGEYLETTGLTDKNWRPTDIALAVDPGLFPEDYKLDIGTGERITVTGGSPAGVFYGVQTLRQLVNRYKLLQIAELPRMVIEDGPQFGYRGGMLDVCRHFFTVDEVKRYIDILALHKMNKFHWHLTEDQGWRIAIDKYPELTTTGAYRSGTIMGHAAGAHHEFDDIPYGGYYTKDDIREVVAYAAERYIEVIPEIEMPGHASAAIASYPWLGCRGERIPVERAWGVFPDVFCAGKESTFDFLQDVLEEVIELFPSTTIHIGGDECPKVRWEECPHCQQRIADEGLADEHELQGYLMKRIEGWLRERGRNIIGWDEILEGGVSETATVMSWRGSAGGIEAARMGNYVVMAPNSHCYLDYFQHEPVVYEPQGIGGYLPVEKVYTLDPYEGLDDEQKKYILGVQANLWTEYIKHEAHLQYMLLPRLAAIAETGWTGPADKDYEGFRDRMRDLADIYEAEGYKYAKYIFD